jgi:hypothetical protein
MKSTERRQSDSLTSRASGAEGGGGGEVEGGVRHDLHVDQEGEREGHAAHLGVGRLAALDTAAPNTFADLAWSGGAVVQSESAAESY